MGTLGKRCEGRAREAEGAKRMKVYGEGEERGVYEHWWSVA